MHLSNCKIVSNLNYTSNEFGMDCYEKCLDKFLFENYEKNISYCFNSRGFRDEEWPKSSEDLQQSIWCLGESFTMGIGSPIEYTWPKSLQNLLSIRTINVSLDGASNTWIHRKALDILKHVKPVNMVIAWTFIGRDEDPNSLLLDEQRKLDFNWKQNKIKFNFLFEKLLVQIKEIEQIKGSCNIVHMFVPSFDYGYTKEYINKEIKDLYNLLKGKSWPNLCENFYIPEFVKKELIEYDAYENLVNLLLLKKERMKFDDYIQKLQIVEYQVLDTARDGFHFDIITANDIAQKCQVFIRKQTS